MTPAEAAARCTLRAMSGATLIDPCDRADSSIFRQVAELPLMNAHSRDSRERSQGEAGAQALWDQILEGRLADRETHGLPHDGVPLGSDVPAVVVEIHVPLAEDDPAWIPAMQERLDGAVVESRSISFDDGEEWINAEGDPEYLFFLHNAPLPTLLGIAGTIATEVGAPQGIYATINDGESEMGEGRELGPVVRG